MRDHKRNIERAIDVLTDHATTMRQQSLLARQELITLQRTIKATPERARVHQAIARQKAQLIARTESNEIRTGKAIGELQLVLAEIDSAREIRYINGLLGRVSHVYESIGDILDLGKIKDGVKRYTESREANEQLTQASAEQIDAATTRIMQETEFPEVQGAVDGELGDMERRRAMLDL